MVKIQHQLVMLFTIFIFITLVGTATAQRQYHLEHEWATIWINQDGTIDLLYDISITLDSGEAINYVYVGQPKSDFTIGPAMDQYGHNLTTAEESEGGDYRVRVNLYTPLPAEQTVRFNLTTNVAHMIWEDTSENVGMEFKPCYWDAELKELHVLVVLPQGVTKENVGCTPDWDNAYYDPAEDNRLVLYWERYDLPENQEFPCGVSFPKEYVQHYDVPEKGLEWLLPIAFIFFGILVVVVVVYKRVPLRKYMTPNMRMEALGIRHGLTAVEASHLLGLPPTKIVTEILYSLLMKKAIWVTATTPALKLKVMELFKDKTGTPETALRYYEKSFLDAVKRDGTLKEEKLAKTVVLLRDTVEKKLRGYCRGDTITYYKKVVGEAWEQVERAGTPELASKAYDENLLWLLLHEGFKSRTEDVFRDKMFEPGIGWWWYWYGYTSYHPNPTYKPSPTTTQPTSPPTIPGADFANNIATSVEKTANNIVANVEKFANSIVPAPPPSAKTSRAPAHHKSSCACACAACACVCACVSCACACASGGVG
jgi:hypothetical protein